VGIECSLLSRSDKGRAYDRFRGRLMFPIRGLGGKVIAFGGRVISAEQKEEAKYINSSDSPIYKKGEHLYGLPEARRAISTGEPAMLTEGYMDVITLHQFGYGSAVGVLGTALTDEQIRRLSGFTSNVELLFDGDQAGRKAALRSAEMLLTRGISCKVILFPEGEDIDSLLRGRGKEHFEALRVAAPSGINFCARALKSMALKDAVEWSRDFLGKVSLPELVSPYASVLATQLGLDEKELRAQNIKARKARAFDAPALDAAKGAGRHDNRDRQVMTFAARYPHMLEKLREAGGHLALSSAWAKGLWKKMEEGTSPDNIFQLLDEKQKQFWILCRTASAPLCNEAGEFEALCKMIGQHLQTRESASFCAALGQSDGDFEADKAYLSALQQNLNQRKKQFSLQKGDASDD
jgi:DNA primase